MIDIKGITKSFGSLQVLKGIDLHIDKGEVVSIVGPSGAGKTTLLQIMGTLDKPDSGAISVDGVDVMRLSSNKLSDFRNQHIGFVFQNFNLLSRITALDNVALPLVYAGVGRKERTERAMDKLKSVGLETWAHHKPNELSGGQRQRVAIARALVNNPHIIMADEPTGNLDTKSTKDIMRLFEELHEDHKTIILVTHEPEIAACATRQLLLSDGKITKDAGKGVVMDVI